MKNLRIGLILLLSLLLPLSVNGATTGAPMQKHTLLDGKWHSNTTSGSPSVNDVIKWNGSKWVAGAQSAPDLTALTAAINTAYATVASHATTSAIWAAAGNIINFTGGETITALPATCTAGVGYWVPNATDDPTAGSCSDFTGFIGLNPTYKNPGTLYICGATGWADGSTYTPYTYPHPLRGKSRAAVTFGSTSASGAGRTMGSTAGSGSGFTLE